MWCVRACDRVWCVCACVCCVRMVCVWCACACVLCTYAYAYAYACRCAVCVVCQLAAAAASGAAAARGVTTGLHAARKGQKQLGHHSLGVGARVLGVIALRSRNGAR